MDKDIIDSLMVVCRKVSTNRCFRRFGVCDAIEVTFKSFLYSVLGLSHILLGTFFAADAIDKVIAVASGFLHGGIGYSCRGASDLT